MARPRRAVSRRQIDDVLVDATSGAVVRRTNRVLAANAASIYPAWPDGSARRDRPRPSTSPRTSSTPAAPTQLKRPQRPRIHRRAPTSCPASARPSSHFTPAPGSDVGPSSGIDFIYPFDGFTLATRAAAPRAVRAVRLGSGDAVLLAGQPRTGRRPALLARQRVPRSSRCRADRLRRRRRRLRGRRSDPRAVDGRRRHRRRPPGLRPPRQLELHDAPRRDAGLHADVPVRRLELLRFEPVLRGLQRRGCRDRLSRVRPRPVEPAHHRHDRLRRAQLAAGRRDGRGVERLVRVRRARPPRQPVGCAGRRRRAPGRL